MKKQYKIIVILIVFLVSNSAKADSWFDPQWKQMIDSSDLVALVQYTSAGEFRAKAKIIKLYKGNTNTEEIWISGFSNRYGPIDTMSIGDQYVVFLKFSEPSSSTIEYWSEQLLEDPTLENYINGLKASKAYHVWSPTSGDLKVIGTSIQYDLLQTTYYEEQESYSFEEFEHFLKASFNQETKNFHSKIIKELKNKTLDRDSHRLLLMLYLSSFKEYIDTYEKLLNSEHFEVRFALAKILGQQETDKSREILVKLLSDENSLVQGEVVRQLSRLKPDYVGPILLSHLSSAGLEGLYSSDVMNPVMNQLHGGKVEIIKTLGNIGYQPAAIVLSPLLKTKDEYIFDLILETLNKLGFYEYSEYFNEHLESGNDDLVLSICIALSENNLKQCIPSLMTFIRNHDKSIHPTMEYTISADMGLAHFPTDTVKQFLEDEFLNVIKMKDEKSSNNKEKWIIEFLDVFKNLRITEYKTDLYNCLFRNYGIDARFRNNEKYFKRKLALEDSLRYIVNVIIKPIEPRVETEALVFIGESFNVESYTVKYKIDTKINFQNWEPSRVDTLNNLIFEKSDILDSNLISGGSNISFQNGAAEIVGINDELFRKFLEFLAECPNEKDISFMNNLRKFGYTKSKYENDFLTRMIEKATQNMQK